MIEQVDQNDDLGTLLRLVPLITTGIVLSLYLSIQMSITFLQALAMDRQLGPHFIIPLGSMSMFMIIAASISIPLLNNVIYPACSSLMGKPPTPLQCVGLGFLVTTLAMVYGALAESKRLEALQTSSEPFSVLWLAPCLMMVGLGEALHFPGQLAFFFREFPAAFKGSGSAVCALQSGIASFVTSAVMSSLHKFKGWIENDANESRLDYVYWMLALTGALNFGCFLVFARAYGRKKGNIV